MLFMVIEHFKDVAAIGHRFRAKGRLLPEGATYNSGRLPNGSLMYSQPSEAPPNLRCPQAW
jgi:hypothetical protein